MSSSRPADTARLRVLAALALSVWLSPSRAGAVPEKLVVAVLYFDNNSQNKQYDVLQKGLADMMVTDLAAVDGVQIVERDKLQKLVEELNLQRSSFFDPATAQKLGRGIGATYAVTGAMTAIDPEIRLDVRLIEISTGKVMLTAKIVGPQDRFFELQDQLVAKFAASLSLQRTAGVAPANRVKNVATLLDYSKGVDAEDRGDLQGASVQLARLIQQAPDFHMARVRQDEIARRLARSGKKREAALSNISDELLQHCDDYLSGKDPANMPWKEAGHYFGYRALRGDYILTSIEKRFRPKAILRAHYAESTIAPADQDTVTGLMQAWVENASALISELKSFQAAESGNITKRLAYRIENEDQSRARELGIRWRFMPINVAAADLGLARFLLLGAAQQNQTPARPSLADIDPSVVDRAMGLIDDAIADIKARTGGLDEHEYTQAQELAGEGLVQVGRVNDGLARWQAVLDQFPTSTDYSRIEKLIKDTAQEERDDAEDTAAFKTGPCDMGMVAVAAQAIQRIMKRRGFAGAQAAVAHFEEHCGAKADATTLQSIYMTLGSMAMMVGECSALKELQAKSAKIAPVYNATYEGLVRTCQQ